MTYVVTVDSCIPEGTPEMDPLQRAGALALIEDGFDSVRAVEGPDGVEVDLLDAIVAVHPGGAHLKVIVDAPTLEFAEDSVQVLVDELLERSELLADWTIERCEVELHQDLARKSLDAAEGPGAPPDDPAARKARHTESRTTQGAEEHGDAEAKTTAVRNRLLELANELRSFPPTTFGASDAGAAGAADSAGVTGITGTTESADDADDAEVTGNAVPLESARLAAGALVYATDILVDELFEDMQVLTQEDSTVAECDGPLWHLERLPDRYALRYDARFARRFLVTTIALTTRFTDGSFQRLSCVAEELALRFLLSQTTTTLELYELLDDDVSAALDAFADHVYDDRDHEWLYDGSMHGAETADEAAVGVTDAAGAVLGVAPMTFGSWFTPFNESRYVHPSAADEPEAAAP
ncbi:hypothetical protein OG562_23265 [Streptomyces sp. NBC_01275]|uniref:hypothetical protein n=1 Tax=Streptomyces sp. NBC_01275 TaxID=2903807 RepID=UPI00224DE284|nr:hypothetical protein [Streptomyces sp. NBC_01275]MCX4763834.1 hypothetical protein [Streptomyces sp. NBC_01275]